jgi:hypothetical protein
VRDVAENAGKGKAYAERGAQARRKVKKRGFAEGSEKATKKKKNKLSTFFLLLFFFFCAPPRADTFPPAPARPRRMSSYLSGIR